MKNYLQNQLAASQNAQPSTEGTRELPMAAVVPALGSALRTGVGGMGGHDGHS